MAGEALIIIVGFFRWIFNGCKTNLKDEINGQKDTNSNIRGKNYLIGLVISILIILIFSYIL
jgi:hypothetical protein